MSPDPGVVIFDPAGDIVFLVEITDSQPSHETFPRSESNALVRGTAVHNVPAEDTTGDDSPLNALADDLLTTNGAHDDVDPVSECADVTTRSSHEETTSSSTKKVVGLVKMLVSSRHLALASSYFRCMVEFAGQGSLTHRTPQELRVPVDDSGTLQILLNIVHGLHKKVPRAVERDTLWEAVALIDHYELREITEVFTDMWFAGLQPTLPRGPSVDLASWIYICYELKRPVELEAMTKMAILETDCVFQPAQEARIPYWIIDGMRSHRQRLLGEIFSTLSKLVELYEGPRRVCRRSADRDALALGKLIRGLKSARLYPVPEPADWTISVKDLLSTVRVMELSSVCDESRRKTKKYTLFCDDEKEIVPTCQLDEELRNSLLHIETRSRGLGINGKPAQDKIDS